MPDKEALSALARDHLENPRNLRAFPPELPGRTVSSAAGSAASGAFVRFFLCIADGRIVAARYEVLGPPELLAAASWVADKLTGRTASPAAVPAGMETARTLELPRASHGLALLVEDAVRACLAEPNV